MLEERPRRLVFSLQTPRLASSHSLHLPLRRRAKSKRITWQFRKREARLHLIKTLVAGKTSVAVYIESPVWASLILVLSCWKVCSGNRSPNFKGTACCWPGRGSGRSNTRGVKERAQWGPAGAKAWGPQGQVSAQPLGCWDRWQGGGSSPSSSFPPPCWPWG